MKRELAGRRHRRTFVAALVWFIFVLPGGQAALPASSEQPMPPLIIERTYAAGFGEVWSQLESSITAGSGEIRFADRDSGLVFYSVAAPQPASPVYVNVYLEALGTTRTRVYFTACTWGGRSLEPVEQEIFQQLNTRFPGGEDAAN